MKRVRELGAQLQYSSNPFAQIPHEVMPNIWSRLPEESLAALLCADTYLSRLHGANNARRQQRKVVLALRPRLCRSDSRVFLSVYASERLDACKDSACDANVRARNLALISKVGIKIGNLWFWTCESRREFFDCLQSLNKNLQAQFLESVLRQGLLLDDFRRLDDFARFLRLFGGEEKDIHRALSEISGLGSLSPKCAVAFRIWLLELIGCETDASTVDPSMVFAALVDHLKSLQDVELAHALPWLPTRLVFNAESHEGGHNAYVCTRAKARAYLMKTYFDLCARLEPALAVTTHAASIETATLLYKGIGWDLRDRKVVSDVIEAMMESLLELKEKALVVAMQELLRRCPYVLDKRGANPLALCRHIQQSVSEGKAALMVELLMVTALIEMKHEDEGPYFNFAEGDGARAVALRDMFDMSVALPARDMSADALAMLACVVAYMPGSALKSGAVGRIIALMEAKAPSEHLSLWVLLAHLSALLDQADRERVRYMLQQAARHMPQAQSSTLVAALRDADALESLCSGKGVSMKSVYPGLWSVDSVWRSELDLIEATLNHILAAALHEEFLASFFVQLNALRGWRKFGPSKRELWLWDSADQKKTSLIPDNEPQSEEDKLARMASLAAHIQHLSAVSRHDVYSRGRYYVMAMVLRRKRPSMMSWPVELYRAHLKSLHELSIRLGKNADAALRECIDASMAANNTFGVKLLEHWQPLLRDLTLDERYRILDQLASSCYETEVPPSAADLAYLNTMIDLASLLRDGDKPDYLDTLLLQAAMPPCDERERIFHRIREIGGKLFKEFAGQIDTREIVLWTDSKRLRSRVVEHSRKNIPLTHVQVHELIARAGLGRFLNEGQVKIVRSMMLENTWLRADAEKLEPEHWTALLRAFEDIYGKAAQAAGNAAPSLSAAQHTVDLSGAEGRAQTIPELDEHEVDFETFQALGFVEQWFADDMQ